MGLLDYFKSKRKSADVAKERLSILIARDRLLRDQPSFMPMLQQELLEVVKKYIDIENDDFTVSVDRESDCEILELNITLPET